MCGIAGWVAKPDAPLDEAAMARMLEAIAHRGPDDSGMRAFRNAATGHRVMLGHRRLAIIDPNGARQPMCDPAAGVTLSFNGEIYNFRALREELAKRGYAFRRDSDTEVLLRAYQHWGCDVVGHLRGQFAFAIWDAALGRLVLARDRYGEKPLYLAQDASGLYFASEIKALLALPRVPREVSLHAVWDYLAYRYVPAPRTLFAGIRKLMPGTIGVWERGRFTERRYWNAPDQKARSEAIPAGDALEGFMTHLDEAVRLQMVSDVPFGAFLSGGLDSSTVVALMSRHNSKVRTFSVGFKDDGYSELGYAGEVARHFGTAHTELQVDSKDLIELLPKMIAFRDAPVSEPSDIPIYMLAREASRSVKMVLTGEGSDEILGGYPKHVAERFTRAWQIVPACLRRGLIEPLVRALPYGFRRAKTAIVNLNIEDPNERYVRWFGALDRAERDRLSVLRVRNSENRSEAVNGNTPLRSILYFDQTSWLPDNLLERGDRMTMAASIEARVPFLDHRLAEFVSGLPDEYRVRGLRTKWILREAGRRLIPRRILERPKVGFRVPVNRWFRGEMRGFLAEHLLGAGSLTRRYYEPQALGRVVTEHLEGRQNHEKLLWTLLNLEIWHRRYASP
jgi:asparagine synthase (glutamine-hydrolysing)